MSWSQADFDPIHSGHIEYFKAAKELGDILIVGLNSDAWLTRKKGQPFMPFTERISVIENLKMVDRCISFNDDDGSSIEAIKNVRLLYPTSEIIFANGGDVSAFNLSELHHLDKNLTFKFGVGGTTKKNSSSLILESYKNNKIIEDWGWHRIVKTTETYKIKELVIEPRKKLSMQKHNFRGEHWYVLKGKVDIVTEYKSDIIVIPKFSNESYFIEKGVWYQGQNNTDECCHILEVQYGEKCVEDDIERRDA